MLATVLAWAEIIPDPIRAEVKRTQTGIVVVYSNTIPVPVTVKIKPQLTNMFAPRNLMMVIPPLGKSSALVFTIHRSDKSWRYKLPYQYQFGDYRATQPTGAYDLPWKRGDSYRSSQAFHGELSHNGPQKYAVDFPMAEGTQVYASREGYVVYVVEKWTESGTRQELKDRVNQVLVAHSDGTLTRYQHFKHQGVVVEPGQVLAKDQLLGYSGNVGFSTGPHLHFDVSRPTAEFQNQTIPFQLINAGRAENPRPDTLYTRN